MPIAKGCQHIALVTSDLDRFVGFYERIFDASIVFEMDEDGMRHAMVDLGGGLWLHPFHFPDEHSEAEGKPDAFHRGHLDHFAIEVADRDTLRLVRSRLVDEGASDGTITDFGLLELVSFCDPDGMVAEVAVLKSGTPRRFDQREIAGA